MLPPTPAEPVIGQFNLFIVVGTVVTVAQLLWLFRRRSRGQDGSFQLVNSIGTSLIFIGATTLGLIKWFEFTGNGSAISSDFTQDYLAAVALREGVPIYGPEFSKLSQTLFSFTTDNYHPPFNAVLFLPFSLLPYVSAFHIWSLCSLAAYIAVLRSLLKISGLYTYPWIHVSAVLLLWEPFTASIGLGQISVLLAFTIIGGFLLLRAGWERTAGVLFAVAALAKLFPGLLLLYLVSQRYWRATSAFLIAGAAAMLVTAAAAGIDVVVYYVTVVIPNHRYVFAGYPLNISIEGLSRTIFEASQYSRPLFEVAQYLSAFIALASAALVALVLSLGSRDRDDAGVADLFVLYCVTMLLVSPLTWNHTCVLLVLPLSILLRDGISRPRPALVRIASMVLILFWIPFAPLVTYLIGLYSPLPTPWYVMVAAKTGFFGLAILWMVFYRRLRRAS